MCADHPASTASCVRPLQPDLTKQLESLRMAQQIQSSELAGCPCGLDVATPAPATNVAPTGALFLGRSLSRRVREIARHAQSWPPPACGAPAARRGPGHAPPQLARQRRGGPHHRARAFAAAFGAVSLGRIYQRHARPRPRGADRRARAHSPRSPRAAGRSEPLQRGMRVELIKTTREARGSSRRLWPMGKQHKPTPFGHGAIFPRVGSPRHGLSRAINCVQLRSRPATQERAGLRWWALAAGGVTS
jgi:hypothetical protein